MQTLLLPAARSGIPPPSPAVTTAAHLHRRITVSTRFLSPPSSSSSSSFLSLSSTNSIKMVHWLPLMASSSVSTGFSSPVDESDQVKLAQVAKRLEKTARYFKRLGSFGFWGQLICTIVSAVILSFSVVVTGKITSPVTFYATAGGIAAAFISVFWSFGYLRLSEKLRKSANDPSKAPPRADVVRSLKNGIAVNLLGMGSAILGMQATVGLLVAKALTTSANPYYQGVAPGSSPVLALDVFLVQASANTILSHFFGLVSSLELLRSVTLPTGSAPTAKMA
ncbi:protein TIC 21, chloroplastic-like [Chenopodium quinoa]|uniref:protein TIC 21, chloroplastic-like n=1 Tax=Chenopodium quinoa TaxID=63459 RepID=UPI000B79581F|nr:protein TIC 21, chloroplastic-like [Chenopodium quinoa]